MLYACHSVRRAIAIIGTRTDAGEGLLQVCEVNVHGEVAFTWLVEDVHNFMVLECLPRPLSSVVARIKVRSTHPE